MKALKHICCKTGVLDGRVQTYDVSKAITSEEDLLWQIRSISTFLNKE